MKRRILREMSPDAWESAPGPYPVPTCRTQRFAWAFSPERWILLYFRIPVVTHLRLPRDSMGRSNHGGGFRSRYARELATKNGIAKIWRFARLLQRIDDCRLPLHVATKMTYELRELRRIVSERRVRVTGRPMTSLHIGCRAFWEVVARNSNCAGRKRRRIESNGRWGHYE